MEQQVIALSPGTMHGWESRTGSNGRIATTVMLSSRIMPRVAAILRGRAAIKFVADVGRGDPQEVMARVTGNYKRGNERTGRQHSRRRSSS